MNRLMVCVMLLPFLFVALSSAMEGGQVPAAVLPEDYALYDRIIEDKFLTLQIRLVLLEHMTVSRLVPNQPESMTMAFFQQQRFFHGILPQELIRDFIGVSQARSRLESRFRLGVRYRFVSGEKSEDVAARLAVSAMNDQKMVTHPSSVLDRLAFSRVGRTPTSDQALIYVENRRRDGTGAGFLVWFHQREHAWELLDAEVVWTMRGTGDEEETP